MSDHLIGSEDSEIDVEELLAEMREKLARREKPPGAPPPFPRSTPPFFPDILRDGGRAKGSFNISIVRSIIRSAEAQADMGAAVSPMHRFSGPIRWMALLAGKLVIFLSSFMTDKQRVFNRTVLHALGEITDGLESLRLQVESMKLQNGSVKSEQTGIRGALSDLERSITDLKVNVFRQKNRPAMLLEEAKRRMPEPFTDEQPQAMVNEEQRLLDSFYVSFEEQFRGSREEVKERLKVYLPVIMRAGIGAQELPILDIGCGRGEWLELLREEKLRGYGVDRNRLMVELCRSLGFVVAEDDLFHYLQGQPDSSLGAITGFHIIEHLPFRGLVRLIDEAVRVLKQGGLVILETPNPENILVGSCYFHQDPTHHKPLPSSLIKFVAEARGLSEVEIVNLHPFPEALKKPGLNPDAFMTQYIYGPRDYALIGWKT